MISLAAIGFYLASFAILLHQVVKKKPVTVAGHAYTVLALIGAGMVLHSIGAYLSIHGAKGFTFSIYKAPSLFLVVINLIVVFSSIKKPLHNLFIFLLPLSVLAIGLSLLTNTDNEATPQLSPGMITHILLSLLAYSLLTIASLQAVLLAYQNHQLRHKHLRGILGILPPLQTMESLLFELLWAGEVLLSLSIISGVIFIENLFEQHLAHKTVFSILSWMIYATLLWGRHTLGWRGSSAIRWTLCGFAALMLAYFGSKLALEVILHRT